MQSEAQKLIHTDRLKALIKWTNESTDGSSGDFKPAAKRGVALFYALDLDLDRALDLARALDLDRALDRALDLDLDRALDLDLDRARARALDLAKIFNSVDFAALIDQLESMKAQVPSNDEPVEVRRAFADRIRQTWYTALHINPEWLELSEEELKSLENYLYANELMIRCKEAALRVSPQVWNTIESRMLTVSDNETNESNAV